MRLRLIFSRTRALVPCLFLCGLALVGLATQAPVEEQPRPSPADASFLRTRLASMAVLHRPFAATADTVRTDSGRVEAPFLHTVRPGESPTDLATRYGLPVNQLCTFNGLPPADTVLTPGQLLVVGRPDTAWEAFHTVQPGDVLTTIASAYGLTVVQLHYLNGLTDTTLVPGQRLAVPNRMPPATADASPTPSPDPTPAAPDPAASNPTASNGVGSTVETVVDTTRLDTTRLAQTFPETTPDRPFEPASDSTLPPAPSAGFAEANPDTGAVAQAVDTVRTERPVTVSPDSSAVTPDSTRTASSPSDSAAPPSRLQPPSPASDSLLTGRIEPDSVLADSAADSALADVWPDTGLVPRYLTRMKRDRFTASIAPRERRPMQTRLGTYWRHEIKLDSTGTRYVARELIGTEDVRYPLVLGLDDYRSRRLAEDTEQSFRDLVEQRARLQQQRRRQGFGLNIVVPGGRESAFSTIFGKPEVDLRVNGQANIDAGFAYQKSDQTVSLTGKKGRLDPDFGQNIRLSITGTIGDKLSVDVNWDTERTFDFQNQLKLEYTGYEDEIVQKVVAGNVFLQTPSQLIQGGQSLFGIRTDLQLGGIRLTTVASQQEGEAEEINLEGGSQTTEFELKPTDYEDNTHFFVGFFFRSWWNRAFQDPPRITLLQGMDRITDIELWRLEKSQTGLNDPSVRQGVALVDLGEPALLTDFPDSTILQLPGTQPLDERYTEEDLNFLSQNETINDYLRGTLGLEESDFQTGYWRKLQEGRDYEFDEQLGFVSLNTSLSDDEALAVAYKYPTPLAPGQIAEIGDFAAESSGRLVLKLLRKISHNPTNPTWPLTMRNVYNVRGRGFSPDAFELDILYERPGQPAAKTLPGQRQTLLQLLGLDELNNDDLSQNPDNRFDFQSYQINSNTGRLFFPYREPFAAQIATVTDNDQFIFNNLYTQKLSEARQDAQHDVYRIQGSYKSTVQSIYNIPAFGIVEGSVVVSSGGAELSPGTDYIVDYSTGTLNITNPAFLQPGRDVRISFEKSQFAAIQKKTLLGMRADYSYLDKIALGATMLRLSEKPLIDKFRIGEEPLQNMIWGVDGVLNIEPLWLTRAIDALPLIQTKAPSSIQFTGEFAQLLPGSPETIAFKRTRDQLRDDGLDFKGDELDGVSYIDDFESVENSISLKQAGAWRLSSAPDSIATDEQFINEPRSVQDSLRTTYRGNFGWYVLPLNVENINFGPQPADNINAIRAIHVNEVYPNRDVSAETAAGQILTTFDVFFDPSDRGPYNYTTEFNRFADPLARKDMWGGMMQRLPEGYTDFNQNNIEFIEFIFTPYSRTPGGDAGEDAKLYVDLGSISEDVVPDERLNTEDGLSLNEIDRSDASQWARLADGIADAIVKVDEATGRTEDLGLDGYPSKPENRGPIPYETSEQEVFNAFIQSAVAELGTGSALYKRILDDPSGDDYHHFLDDAYWQNQDLFPDGTLLQQRYTRFFAGTELNTFEAQSEIAGNGAPVTGNSQNIPDTEDLNSNATLDSENSYYQYEIPLSRTALDQQADIGATDDFVVNKIEGADPRTGERSTWYTIRIPVRTDNRRDVGGVQDFTLIRSMRLWTTGHTAPVTLRFATMELVGSQWRKSQEIGCDLPTELECDSRDVGELIEISTINNEENQGYQIPEGAIQSKIRTAQGLQNAREQALVLKIDDLQPKDTRAVFKTFNQALNMLKYGNLRMYTHGHGRGFDERGDVRLFLRLGLNEDNDYYEYELPITPSNPLGDANEVWQTNIDTGGGRVDLNSINVELSAFNILKVARDDSLGFPKTREFVRSGYDFAPPGTRLKIKGDPSLSGITTMVIGVRGDSLRNKVVDEAEIWINELRVTEFDSESGWAGLATAKVALADLATLNANIRTQTDGFGPLSSELGSRDLNNVFNWSLTSNFNLHKFIPERFGWNLPITYSIRENRSTPRFSPDRGDIRLQELLQQVEENPNLSAAEKQQEKDEILLSAQTNSSTRSFSVPFSKGGSRSRWMRNTIDGLSLNYSRATSESRDPSTLFNDSRQWSSSMQYRLATRTPRTVRPLWFFGDIPVLGAIGNLRMSYVPQTVQFSASANRNFSESQERSRLVLRENDPALDSLRFESTTRYPVRENHAFGHARSFQFRYNPFIFLDLTYDSNVDQSLRGMSTDTLFSVAYIDTNDVYSFYQGLRLDDALAQGVVPETAVDDGSAVQINRLNLVPVGDVISRLFNGTGDVRTERYGQTFGATFDPKLNRIEALKWITFQPLVYNGRFQWQNGPAGSRFTGAGVSNDVTLRSGLRLAPQDLFRTFGFYQALEKQQRDALNEKRIRNARRTQERQARREARALMKQERQKIQVTIDSLRTQGRAEIDTLMAHLEEEARDSLMALEQTELDTLLSARSARLDSLIARADSTREQRQQWEEERERLERRQEARQVSLDSLRALEDLDLKRQINETASAIDSLQALNLDADSLQTPTPVPDSLQAPFELDSLRTLTPAERDTLVTEKRRLLDSLQAQVDPSLDSLIAVAAGRVDSLQADRLRGAERDSLQTLDLERFERQREATEDEIDALERLRRRGDLDDVLARDNAFILAADSLEAIADSLARVKGGVGRSRTTQEDDGKGSLLGFLNPSGLLRRLALAVTGIRDLSFTYAGGWGGTSSNVTDQEFNLFDAFQGQGPSLAYRLGLKRVIDPSLARRLIADSTLQVRDQLQSNTTLGAQTSLSLSQSLRVDLSWDTKWDEREDISYQLNFDRQIEQIQNQSGTNQASIWAFGSSYDAFFERQLETFLADRNAGQGGALGDENGDGRIVLTNEALVEDFQESFTKSFGQLGSNGFLPFPLPNWSVNWTGLNSLPFFRRLAQSATVRHSYSATYDADFRSNAVAGQEKSRTIRTLQGDGSSSIVPQEIFYGVPELEVGSIRVNERFQPLLSVDVTWQGSVQTGLSWSKSRSYSLNTTNADITKNSTGELSLRTSWSKRGLRLPLPFMRRRQLNNTLSLSLTASRSENVELRYRLEPDLELFLTGREDDETFKNPPPVSSIRLTVEPQLSYTFSNRVSADFFVRYENLKSEGSRVPNTTNVKGGFRVRVSIAN